MEFLEKDLEDIICNTSAASLLDRGLPISKNRIRQVKVGNYGIPDIVTYFRDRVGLESVLIITVYELKKGKINIDTFLQAIGYLTGIKKYIEGRSSIKVIYTICLIGKVVDIDSSFTYVEQHLRTFAVSGQTLPFLLVYTYDYRYDGVYFNRISHYSLQEDGFNV